MLTRMTRERGANTFRSGIAACGLAFAAAPGFAKECANRNVATEKEAKATIAALHDAWARARKERDVEFLEQFYDSDLILNVNDGQRVSRERDIGLFRDGVIKVEYLYDSDLTVRVFCDAAIATGVESLKGTYAGRPGEMVLRFTNVFERQNGDWRLVAHQSTTISAK